MKTYPFDTLEATKMIVSDKTNTPVTESEYIKHGNMWLDEKINDLDENTAKLDQDGKIPAALLPSYVDDVLEFATKSAFPVDGESGKIYVDKSTNLTYRWSGSAYVEISPSIALGETSSTAYPGNKGKQNADNLASHVADTTKHITAAERANWNGKANASDVAALQAKTTSLETAVSNKANTDTVSALSGRVTETETKAENLQSQINTLVIEAGGDSNPEVVQARVDASGKEWGSLKSRIDGDVIGLKSDLKEGTVSEFTYNSFGTTKTYNVKVENGRKVKISIACTGDWSLKTSFGKTGDSTQYEEINFSPANSSAVLIAGDNYDVINCWCNNTNKNPFTILVSVQSYIDSKDEKLSNDISEVLYKKQYEPTVNGYYINSNGVRVKESGAKCTEYVDISGWDVIEYKGRISGCILAFYDENKAFMSSISVKSSSLSMKSGEIKLDSTYNGAKYAIVSEYGNNGSYIVLRRNDGLLVNYDDVIKNTDNLAYYNYVPTIPNLYINSNGAETYNSSASCKCTDFIYIKGCTNVKYKGRILGSPIAFYDKYKNFIGGVVTDTEPLSESTGDIDITVEYPNAVYARVSYYGDNGYITVYSKTSQIKILSDKILFESSLNGKKINALGDSITSIDYTRPNWWEIISERTGSSFNNYGLSSSKISDVPNDPILSFIDRLDTLDTTADGIMVMGGTNDNNVPRGSWNSTDTSTFFGALNVMLTTLLVKFAGKPVMMCTPIQDSTSYANNIANPLDDLLALNDNSSLTRQLRAEAIKAKCKQYGIPCLDLWNESGINGADTDKVYFRSGDNLHPSKTGQERLSLLIQNKLEMLF